MRKGQISFDMLLALIMVTIFANVMIGFYDQYSLAQQEISIRSQQRQIANGLAEIISYSRIIEPSADNAVSYKIPLIYARGMLEPVGCTIQINDNEIVVTVAADEEFLGTGENIVSSVKFSKPGGSPGSAACGEEITIGG